MKFIAQVEVSKENLDDVLIAAGEQWSGLWAQTELNFRDALEGKQVEVRDKEDKTIVLGVLNEEALQRGLNLLGEEQYNHLLQPVVSGEADAPTADAFVQLCIMGKIVFA